MIDDRFRDNNQELSGLEQMSIEEAESRKEALRAERSQTEGNVSGRVQARLQEAKDNITRDLTLIDKVKHYTLEAIGRGSKFHYEQSIKQLYATVEAAKIVSKNAGMLIKEYTSQQKALQNSLRVDQQMLSCNIVQISHYESMMATIEGKLQEADTISVYGISTTEAFALHGERSSAQEILIELNAESNTLTMQIMTTNEEMINIGNTLRIVQQQASEFNGQKIRLDAYRRQVEAQTRLVDGLNGVGNMRDVYQNCAIAHEDLEKLQTKLRAPALEPLPIEDRIKAPIAPPKPIGNKEYWQENIGKVLPHYNNNNKK